VAIPELFATTQKQNMKVKLLFVLIILVSACTTTSKVTTESLVPENNKDVFILSVFIRDRMRNTNERDLNFNELVQNESLSRISNHFENIELEYRGGYISVYYRFSDSRDYKKVELNEKEIEEIKKIKWLKKELKYQYDGEIQFDYGERFCRIRRIITRQ
jgi:hypothetical protein